jgi:hypothetical protein
MAFSLPAGFANRVNRLDELLIDYQAEFGKEKKQAVLRGALRTSCEILKSIDAEKLVEAATEIRRRTDEKIVLGKVIEDGEHFELFLTIVEDKACQTVGLNDAARKRMLSNLRLARALEPALRPRELLGAINYLRDFFCLESNVAHAVDKADYAKRAKWKNFIWYIDTPTKFAWIVGVVIIAIDAALVSPVSLLSNYGAATSIELGKRLLPGGGDLGSDYNTSRKRQNRQNWENVRGRDADCG